MSFDAASLRFQLPLLAGETLLDGFRLGYASDRIDPPSPPFLRTPAGWSHPFDPYVAVSRETVRLSFDHLRTVTWRYPETLTVLDHPIGLVLYIERDGAHVRFADGRWLELRLEPATDRDVRFGWLERAGGGGRPTIDCVRDPATSVLRETRRNGRPHLRFLCSEGRLLAVERAQLSSPRACGMGYDEQGQLTSARDETGAEARIRSEHGRVTQLRTLRGAMLRLAYRHPRAFFCASAENVEAGHIWRFNSLGKGHYIVTDSVGRSWQLFRTVTHLREVIAPDGRKITRDVRIQRGGLIVDAASDTSLRSEYEYDADGHLVKAVRGEEVHRYRYDASDRLAHYDGPSGERTRLGWDGEGKLALLETELGLAEPTRDEHGELSTVRWSGIATPATYRVARDDAGHVRALADAAAAEVYELDDGGRRVATYRGDLAVFRVDRDVEGLATSWYDGASTWRLERDTCGRVVGLEDGTARWTLHLDGDGQLRCLENARGDLHEIEIDRGGRAVTHRGYAGVELTYRLDSAGSIAAARSGGRDLSLERDTHGRLVAIAAALRPTPAERGLASPFEPPSEPDRPQAPRLALEWGLDGELERVSGACVAATLVREATHLTDQQGAHSVQESSQPAGGWRLRSSLGLDLSLTPAGSAWHLAGSHRDARISLRIEGSEHRPVRIVGQGVEERRHYDAAGRVSRVDWRTDTEERSARYDWRSPSRLASEHQGELVRQLTHDAAGCLRALTLGARALARSVDACGYATALDEPVFRGDGALRSARGWTFEHDDAGRRIADRCEDRARTYDWDALGRLSSVCVERGHERTRCEYEYDGFGRLVRRVVSREGGAPEESSYVWDGARLLHRVTAGGVTTFIWLGARPLSCIDERGAVRYFVTDAVGLPICAVEAGAGITWRGSVDPWGGIQTLGGGGAGPSWSFPGYWVDEAAGLLRTTFRVLDPHTGLHLDPHPLGPVALPDAYGYLRDPLSEVSPHGLGHGCLPGVVAATRGSLGAEWVGLVLRALRAEPRRLRRSAAPDNFDHSAPVGRALPARSRVISLDPTLASDALRAAWPVR